MGFEGIEAGAPQPPVRGDPVVDLPQGPRSHAIDPLLGGDPGFDQAHIA